MKIYIKSSTGWKDLSGSDQMAVEYASRYYESGDYNLEDAVYKACDDISYGNAEPEYSNESFYLEEPDYKNVLDYMKLKYNS